MGIFRALLNAAKLPVTKARSIVHHSRHSNLDKHTFTCLLWQQEYEREQKKKRALAAGLLGIASIAAISIFKNRPQKGAQAKDIEALDKEDELRFAVTTGPR